LDNRGAAGGDVNFFCILQPKRSVVGRDVLHPAVIGLNRLERDLTTAVA
jgi:hypothetical protein